MEIEGEGVKLYRSYWTAWSLWTVLQTGMLKEIEGEGVRRDISH